MLPLAPNAQPCGLLRAPTPHIQPDPRDREVFDYFIEQLNQRELAYLHLGIFDDSLEFDFLGGRSISISVNTIVAPS